MKNESASSPPTDRENKTNVLQLQVDFIIRTRLNLEMALLVTLGQYDIRRSIQLQSMTSKSTMTNRQVEKISC